MGSISTLVRDFSLLSESGTLWLLHPSIKKVNLRKSHNEQGQFIGIKTCLHLLYKIFPLNYFLHLKFSGGGENGGVGGWGRETFEKRHGVSLLGYLYSLRFSGELFTSSWRSAWKLSARAHGTAVLTWSPAKVISNLMQVGCEHWHGLGAAAVSSQELPICRETLSIPKAHTRWRGYPWSFPHRKREITRFSLDLPAPAAAVLPQTGHRDTALEPGPSLGRLALTSAGADRCAASLLLPSTSPPVPQAPAPHCPTPGHSAQLPWACPCVAAQGVQRQLQQPLQAQENITPPWGTRWEVKLSSYRPSKRKELHFRTYPKISCSFWKYFSFMSPKERKYSTK